MFNVKRIVDINILHKGSAVVEGTRGTVVLFTSEGTAGTTNIVSSAADIDTHYASMSTFPITRAYLKTFFDNGGFAVKVIEGKAVSSVTAANIKALPDEQIVVCFASNNAATAYTAIKTLATTLAADATVYGANEKLLIAPIATASNTDSVKNLIVKYTGSSETGIEMTIAAYLSKIDVYGQSTVNDYCYTAETVTGDDVSDADFATLVAGNINFDTTIAGAVRAFGGNCKNGEDFVNEFVRIVLHQTLSERLIELLTGKLAGSEGVAKIVSSISNELSRYAASGYLTFDKVWTDPDYTVNYNEKQYTVIAKGTPIEKGYHVMVVPFTDLSDADIAAHKAPPVYVVIADRYGIRTITVNGTIV